MDKFEEKCEYCRNSYKMKNILSDKSIYFFDNEQRRREFIDLIHDLEKDGNDEKFSNAIGMIMKFNIEELLKDTRQTITIKPFDYKIEENKTYIDIFYNSFPQSEMFEEKPLEMVDDLSHILFDDFEILLKEVVLAFRKNMNDLRTQNGYHNIKFPYRIRFNYGYSDKESELSCIKKLNRIAENLIIPYDYTIEKVDPFISDIAEDFIDLVNNNIIQQGMFYESDGWIIGDPPISVTLLQLIFNDWKLRGVNNVENKFSQIIRVVNSEIHKIYTERGFRIYKRYTIIEHLKDNALDYGNAILSYKDDNFNVGYYSYIQDK